jgi:hypothetical protein
VGDWLASAYGVPGLLHFVYVWKPWRQYAMARFPAQLAEHAQRKALLRAYAHAHDAVTAGGGGGGVGKGAPRHFVASFPELAGQPFVASFPELAGQPHGRREPRGRGGGGAEGGADAGGATGPGGDVGGAPPPGVATIAAINTTHALLLAAFDASVPHADVPAAMERLAKALRADNDKLLLASPGSL